MAPLIKMVSLLLLVCLCCLGVGLLDCRVHINKISHGQTNEMEEEVELETAVYKTFCTRKLAKES